MKILFGIQLNGNGHATRSIQLIRALQKEGHQVDVITSGNNSQVDIPFERRHFEGLTMHMTERGSIDWYKTFKEANIKQFFRDIKTDVSGYDLAITDFEPITAWAGKKSQIPVIGFGNQYAYSSNKQPRPSKRDRLSEAFLKRFAKCELTIPLSYERLEPTFALPLLDQELIQMERNQAGHFLVYLPAHSTEIVKGVLGSFPERKWIVYSKDQEGQSGSITLKKIGSQDFKKDFAECDGIITAAGFSTTGEALAMGKKLWSIPVKKQYEQICNAIHLKRMGVFTNGLTTESLEEWLSEWSPIEYHWEDPMEQILNRVRNIEMSLDPKIWLPIK